MASKSAERKEPVTRGTGNVFADLGFPDAAERQAKLRLAYALNQVLEARKLSQADAAKVLGVTQPKVSALRHYKLEGFSVERLMNLLTALDQDVEIVIRRKPRSRKAGRISVVAARWLRHAMPPLARRCLTRENPGMTIRASVADRSRTQTRTRPRSQASHYSSKTLWSRS
jgi:predicted XRE-type DNA-binding protein